MDKWDSLGVVGGSEGFSAQSIFTRIPSENISKRVVNVLLVDGMKC